LAGGILLVGRPASCKAARSRQHSAGGATPALGGWRCRCLAGSILLVVRRRRSAGGAAGA